MMTPRAEALAFRVWQFANPRGWDCTASEVAEAIGSTYHAIGKVCAAKGWSNRLRTTERERWEGRFADIVGNIADGFSGNRRVFTRLAEELPE